MWKLLFFVMLSVGVQGDPIKSQDYFKLNTKIVCTDNTTEYNVGDVMAVTSTFKECINGLLDYKVIGREIEEATPTKSFETVFKKYCAKAPQVKACILAFMTGLTPCLPTGMAANAKKFYSNGIDFVCYNEGARLTSFFKEDGPKCFAEKHTDFSKCGQIVRKFNGILALTTEQERCTLGGQYTTCMVAAVKTCSNPTPGNLVEGLRQVYFSSFNCPEVKETREPHDESTITRLG